MSQDKESAPLIAWARRSEALALAGQCLACRDHGRAAEPATAQSLSDSQKPIASMTSACPVMAAEKFVSGASGVDSEIENRANCPIATKTGPRKNGVLGMCCLSRLLVCFCVGALLEVSLAAEESFSFVLCCAFSLILLATIVAVAVMRAANTMADD